MHITEVETAAEARAFMTAPTPELVECVDRLDGDFLVLGAGGKMGPDLVETLIRALRQSEREPRVAAASRFSDPDVKRRLQDCGADIYAGDLRDRSFLDELPDCKNVVFMPGLKFGSSADWVESFHQNSILPYLVGERYADSRIVVFSSGNPYPHTPVDAGGSTEKDDLEPQGIYGWTVVSRECSFRVTADRHDEQAICLYRLFYSQHLFYGVLVDLARMVKHGERISLAMPAVNLISQRDAIDVALRSLEYCDNPPLVLNVAGEAVRVRHIAERFGDIIGCSPHLVGPEPDEALLGNDERCRQEFGDYRDTPDEMIQAVGQWVKEGKKTWDEPTLFGRVDHRY